MRAISIEAGMRFGRYTAIAEGPRHRLSSGVSRRTVLCVCDCGVQKTVFFGDLRSGQAASCGCFGRARLGNATRTHGQSKTQLHWVWESMKRRCFDPKDKRYSTYGARGITVCDRWRESFEAFLEDMGERPPGRSLDRIDNSKGYEPGNVRWATAKEQARNKGNNKMVLFRGEAMCLAEAVEQIGCNYSTLHSSLRANSSLAKSLGVSYVQP